jgi:hypothetical protein
MCNRRHCEVEGGGEGLPSRGVLSPLLWNFLVSKVLTRFKRSLPQLLSQAFADDDGQRVLCFTDGSKMEGMAGSGFFVSGLDAL